MCILRLVENGLKKYRLATKWEQFKIVLLFMDHPVVFCYSVRKLLTRLHGTVKTNALVDRLTPRLQRDILENEMDPMELPDLDTEVGD